MLNTRSQNSHLIFVKNVPGDLANEGIPKLFDEYKPLVIKNIYPHSSVTTMVLSFRSRAEAIRAKEGGQDKRLGNAVLRTEMYEDRRSIRFNRGQGQAKGKANNNESDDTEDAEAPAYTIRNKPRSKKGLVAAKAPNTVADKSWAKVASKPRIEERSEFPDLPTNSHGNLEADLNLNPTDSANPVPPEDAVPEDGNHDSSLAADAPHEQPTPQGSDMDDGDSDETVYQTSHNTSLFTAPDTTAIDTAPSTSHNTPEKADGKEVLSGDSRRETINTQQPPINISFEYDSNARNMHSPSQISDTTRRIRANHQVCCSFCRRSGLYLRGELGEMSPATSLGQRP